MEQVLIENIHSVLNCMSILGGALAVAASVILSVPTLRRSVEGARLGILLLNLSALLEANVLAAMHVSGEWEDCVVIALAIAYNFGNAWMSTLLSRTLHPDPKTKAEIESV